MSADEPANAGDTVSTCVEENVNSMNDPTITTMITLNAISTHSDHATNVESPSTTNTNITSPKISNAENQIQNTLDAKQQPPTTSATSFTTSINPDVSNQNQSANTGKRVIRKIMVIDPKKLQQAGLDRKLAEAIGRQKLKALAKEKKQSAPKSLDTNVASSKTQLESKTQMTVTSAEKLISAGEPKHIQPSARKAKLVPPVETANIASVSASTIPSMVNAMHAIPVAPPTPPTVIKLETVKNCLLVPPGSEKATPFSNVAIVNCATPTLTATKSPTPERKVFVTPKITITRPGEVQSPLGIISEQRLENVKYILQCKILKKQQFAALQSPKSAIITDTTMPQQLSSNTQTPLLKSKGEVSGTLNISASQELKKPSPAKTPQDVARILNFSKDAPLPTLGPTSAAVTMAEVNKSVKLDAASTMRIKNYMHNVPAKPDTTGTSVADVKRLIARLSNVTMRQVSQQPSPVRAADQRDTASSSIEIPKATIRCIKLPMESKCDKASPRKPRTTKMNVATTKNTEKTKSEQIAMEPLPTLKNCGLSHENKSDGIPYKALNKEPSETNVTNKTFTTTTQPISYEHNETKLSKDFPKFSPLKQPFPVVTHSQDLPLPTISTFKSPFPTTLIKVASMGQNESDIAELPALDNFVGNTYVATTGTQNALNPGQKSLIVLEHKVLSHDEKIDLTSLSFATPKVDTKSETHALEVENTELLNDNAKETTNVNNQVSTAEIPLEYQNAHESSQNKVLLQNEATDQESEPCVPENSSTTTESIQESSTVLSQPIKVFDTQQIERKTQVHAAEDANVASSQSQEADQTPIASTSTSSGKVLSIQQGATLNKRTILSMDKINLSAAKIAELVKTIRAKNPNAPKHFLIVRKGDGLQKVGEKPATCTKVNLNITTNTAGNTTPATIKESLANTSSMDFRQILTGASLTQKPAETTGADQISKMTKETHSIQNPNNLSAPTSTASESFVTDVAPITCTQSQPITEAQPLMKTTPLLEPQHVAQQTVTNSQFLTESPKFSEQQPFVEPLPVSEQPSISEPKSYAKTETITQIEMASGPHLVSAPSVELVSESASVSALAPVSVMEPQPIAEVKFKNPLPRLPRKISESDRCFHNRSAATVIDSGDESDTQISAVDFIASLAAENPITEDMKLELSPEELNLNASFAMNFSPLRIPNRERTESLKSELIEQDIYDAYNVPNAETLPDLFEPEATSDDMQIGKIITISEENILKAVAASNQAQDSNKQTNLKAQEVFKLTKSTECLAGSTEEEMIAVNMENVNNLDIVKTDSLAESKVGPIIVKNIEIGVINNLEEARASPVIVKNLESSLTADIGVVGGNVCDVEESAAQAKIAKADKSVPDLEEKAQNKILNLQGNTNTLVEKENEHKVTPITDEESVFKQRLVESITEASPRANELPNFESSTISEEKSKPSEGETSTAAPKPRLPRFKKGKINLVQRRRANSNNQNIKPELNKSNQNAKETSKDQKEPAKETTIKETKVLAKIAEVEKGEEIEKIVKASAPKEEQQSLSSELTAKQEENATFMLADHEIQSSSTHTVEQPLGEINEESLESSTDVATSTAGETMRRIASVSELLNPPKLLKRKSAGPSIKPGTPEITDISTEQNTTNMLLNAINCASEEVELAPPQIPFKKPKIDAFLEEKPIKGIQNLLTKFNKDKNVVENIAVDTDKSIKDNLVKNKVKNCLDTVEKSNEPVENCKQNAAQNHDESAEQSKAGEHLSENAVNKIELTSKSVQQKSEAEYRLAQGNSKELNTANVGVSESATITTAEAQKASDAKDCDILHVITKEKQLEQIDIEKEAKIETASAESKENNTKPKSEFHGFNHNSPTTQNIESNLRHILTITTSAENTNTREVNFSIAERESPHTSQPGKSVLKGASTTPKSAPKKVHFKQTRRSMNRRSVPLKKRWEVLRESDDDINVTDDASPADDDEEHAVNLRTTLNSTDALKCKSKIDESEVVEESEMQETDVVKEEIAEDKSENATGKACVLPDSKKRNRANTEGIDVEEIARDTSTLLKAVVSPKDAQRQIKKVRSNIKSEDMNLATSTEIKGSATSVMELEATAAIDAPTVQIVSDDTGKVQVKEVKSSTRGRRSASRASEDTILKTEQTTEKPQTKVGGRKRKPNKNECNDSTTDVQIANTDKEKTELTSDSNQRDNNNEDLSKKVEKEDKTTTKATKRRSKKLAFVDPVTENNAKEEENQKAADNSKNSLPTIASTSDTNNKENADDSAQQKEIENKTTKATKRQTKKQEMLGPVVEETKIETETPKPAKRQYRKSKIKYETSVINTTATDLPVNEEPMIIESQTAAQAQITSAVECKPNTLKLNTPNQEFATSTPRSENPKRGRKRKSLFEEKVGKFENETLITEDIATVVPKKRGSKAKTARAALDNTSISVVCNGLAEFDKTVEITQESVEQNSALSMHEPSMNETVEIKPADLETPVKIPKKRGRKPKALLNTTVNTDASMDTPETAVDGDKPKKKRAGKRPNVIDLEERGTFNERHLLMTNRAQLNNDEVLTAEPVATTSKTNLIQCGLCLQQMAHKDWLDHLATHYGVGWIVGEMTPINVTFRNEVLKAMAAFLKTHGDTYTLACRLCQRTYRSALGILLHIESCGATDTRAPCDYCHKEYMKGSLPIHMRGCSQRFLKEEKADEVKEDTTETVLNNVGRFKRVAVQRAEKILKAIGSDTQTTAICTFKDAKKYVGLMPTTVIPTDVTEKWSNDLETIRKAQCPASNCTFSAETLTALQEHYTCCKLRKNAQKSAFVCQLCGKSSKSYSSSYNVIQHILQAHKAVEFGQDFEADTSDCGIKTDDETSDDDNDVSSGVDSHEESLAGSENSLNEDEEQQENIPKRRSRKKKQSTLNANLADKLHPPRELDYSQTTKVLWQEFITANYSTRPLFTDAKVNYSICARADYEKYLPRSETSMKFNMNRELRISKLKPDSRFGVAQDLEWSQLKRFETTVINDEQFTYIGDAIKMLKWVPLPGDVKDQYLLLATRRDYTRFKNPKVSNTLLWLYKVTGGESKKIFQQQIHYAISIPDGPVHCVAFLPSGGYDEQANRLGLLAVGVASSTIKVYALPLSIEKATCAQETTEKTLEDFITVQLQPVWLLKLDVREPSSSGNVIENTQCTSLCWSEFAGHAHIFAGFANGCVGYWDITNDMNVNRFLIDGMPNYVPMNSFYTRQKNVRCMALHYDDTGVRVIAVIVDRRLLQFYDIQQFDRPKLLKEEVGRNEVSELEWSPIWQSVAIAISGALPNGHCSYAVNPTNIVYKNETIEKMNGGVNSIHYHPTHNIFANGTDNGDLVLLDIREIHLKDIMRDTQRSSHAAAIMDMVALNGTDIPKFDVKNIPKDWTFMESDVEAKYGLIFGPIKGFERTHRKEYLNTERSPPIHLLHCTRVNTLKFNLNRHGKNLLAAGYENGFLRLVCVDGKTCFK